MPPDTLLPQLHCRATQTVGFNTHHLMWFSPTPDGACQQHLGCKGHRHKSAGVMHVIPLPKASLYPRTQTELSKNSIHVISANAAIHVPCQGYHGQGYNCSTVFPMERRIGCWSAGPTQTSPFILFLHSCLSHPFQTLSTLISSTWKILKLKLSWSLLSSHSCCLPALSLLHIFLHPFTPPLHSLSLSLVLPFCSLYTSTNSVTQGTRQFLYQSGSVGGHPEGRNSTGQEHLEPCLQRKARGLTQRIPWIGAAWEAWSSLQMAQLFAVQPLFADTYRHLE